MLLMYYFTRMVLIPDLTDLPILPRRLLLAEPLLELVAQEQVVQVRVVLAESLERVHVLEHFSV